VFFSILGFERTFRSAAVAKTQIQFWAITIANSGDLTANGFGNAWGIQADAGGPHSAIAIENNGM